MPGQAPGTYESVVPAGWMQVAIVPRGALAGTDFCWVSMVDIPAEGAARLLARLPAFGSLVVENAARKPALLRLCIQGRYVSTVVGGVEERYPFVPVGTWSYAVEHDGVEVVSGFVAITEGAEARIRIE
jgi:hypothetical protein